MQKAFARLKTKNVVVTLLDGTILTGKVLSVEDGAAELSSEVQMVGHVQKSSVFVAFSAVATLRERDPRE
jgi:hypothetical protein